MWNVLRYPAWDDLTGKAYVCRSFPSIKAAVEFIEEQLAERVSDRRNYGIVKATMCGYCHDRPAVGHDGMSAYCKECKK